LIPSFFWIGNWIINFEFFHRLVECYWCQNLPDSSKPSTSVSFMVPEVLYRDYQLSRGKNITVHSMSPSLLRVDG